MKKGIIMIAPVFARPPLFFLLTSWILPPLSLLSPQGKKKNGQQISILLSGNINRAHATSTLHSSHCSSPDASCFFGSFCTDPTRLTHGLEAERRRILAVAPPPPSHGQKAKAGTWWLTDSEPLLTRFFCSFIDQIHEGDYLQVQKQENGESWQITDRERDAGLAGMS